MPTRTTDNGQRTKLNRRLHAAAVEACEARGLDLDAHELARQACGVASLKEATDAQLRSAIRRLQAGPPRNPNPGTRTPRKRRARPSSPGVIKLVTPAQRALIQKLFKQLGWCETTAIRRLGGDWRREPNTGTFDGKLWNDEVRTAKQASEIINILIGESKRNRM